MRTFGLIALIVAACFTAPPAELGAPRKPRDLGLPFVGPTHPPTTPAQWELIDTQARAAAESGGDRLVAAFHVTTLETVDSAGAQSPCVMVVDGRKKVLCAERIIPVAGALCYTVAVAWSYRAKASVDVVFFSDRVSQTLGGKHFELDPAVGTGRFCTDGPGRVSVRVNALTKDRVIINDELLEYSVALAGAEENSAQAAVRQEQETEDVRAARARMEANVYAAELREHGEAFAAICRRCRNAAKTCKDGPNACNDAFEACAQAAGTDRRGRILCTRP